MSADAVTMTAAALMNQPRRFPSPASRLFHPDFRQPVSDFPNPLNSFLTFIDAPCV
jgi:hypothetical protein